MTQRALPTTVLVHGFLDDAAVWDPVLALRSRRTPTVLAELAGMAGRPDADGSDADHPGSLRVTGTLG